MLETVIAGRAEKNRVAVNIAMSNVTMAVMYLNKGMQDAVLGLYGFIDAI
jgi:hypothetical protein